MDFSFYPDDLNRQLDGLQPINFSSVKQLPGLEARTDSATAASSAQTVGGVSLKLAYSAENA